MLLELPVLDPATDVPAEAPATAKQWRSLAHLNNTPEFQAATQGEFLPETFAPSGPSRRTFLQIMGASMAMAGLAGCRRPVENILPYSRQPEEIIPGKPLHYATAMPFAGSVQPLVVESHEGRPSKVDGNPEHPAYNSGSSVFAQASVLNMYDPERTRVVRHNGDTSAWVNFADFARTHAGGAASSSLAVLCESSSSPTLSAVRDALANQYGQFRWVTYDPVGSNYEVLGTQMAFGRPLQPRYRFAQAKVIVSLEADFLGDTHPNSVDQKREYAESRRVMETGDDMSRLYVVENTFSTTGGMADHHLRIRSSEIPAFACAIAARLGMSEYAASGSAFADHPWVSAIADDLRAHRGEGLLLAGYNQPVVVHALCAVLNQALGNVGRTVELLDTGATQVSPQEDDLRALVESMNAGNVDTLVIIGSNPIYDAPTDLNFAAALGHVDTTIYVGPWEDETATQCTWHIPRSHYLEAWGDGRAYDGTLSVIQPLIAPLYDSKSEIEVLNILATGRDTPGYELVRAQWGNVLFGDFEKAWQRVLHDGFLPNTAYASVANVQGRSLAAAMQTFPSGGTSGIEVVFRPDAKAYDGTFSNNAWMQELPDPVTKVTWDGVALMNRATAEALGLEGELKDGKYYTDVVEISANGQTIEMPVWITPGHADQSITLTFGYGRNIQSQALSYRDFAVGDMDTDIYNEGPLANGIGGNAFQLRTTLSQRWAGDAQIRRAERGYMVASTQDHGTMVGRPMLRYATLDQYRADPHFAEHAVHTLPGAEPWDEYPNLWEERNADAADAIAGSKYAHYQWGMVVDLNTCTGCNACIVACQSENNVQVVGKDQVGRGREMSWLRLDRYYISEDNPREEDPNALADPMMMMMPVMCVHCENAPCEQVCPVNATSHSPDGINEMTYNRCIGTRYCANNCPYKVRRFNFHNWTKYLPESVQMTQNPNVTVRFRGVMEKCTYCVQRVREANITAKLEKRLIADREIKTACEVACSAEAITFGNVADPNSAVSTLKRNDRRYELLAELNVKPRTSYLARLRNPNPVLEPAREASPAH